MYNWLRTSIELGEYELEKLFEIMATFYADGSITIDEYAELRELAINKYNPEKELPPIEERFDILVNQFEALSEEFDSLKNRVAILEGEEPVEEPEPGEEPGSEYPEWKRPISVFRGYKRGDIVSYNNKLYQSQINGNVLVPGFSVLAWAEYEPEEEPVEEIVD